MEDDLDKIAEGNEVWYDVLKEFYDSFEPSVKEAFDKLPKKKLNKQEKTVQIVIVH